MKPIIVFMTRFQPNFAFVRYRPIILYADVGAAASSECMTTFFADFLIKPCYWGAQ